MAAYIILFVLSVGVIITSPFIVSSAKKYLRSSDKSSFAAVRVRFRISLFLFIPLLAVLAFMLIFDFGRTVYTFLLLYMYMVDTVYWIMPLLFLGSLISAAVLWIYSADLYREANKAYRTKAENTP